MAENKRREINKSAKSNENIYGRKSLNSEMPRSRRSRLDQDSPSFAQRTADAILTSSRVIILMPGGGTVEVPGSLAEGEKGR